VIRRLDEIAAATADTTLALRCFSDRFAAA
jgi:hypothetical protein